MANSATEILCFVKKGRKRAFLRVTCFVFMGLEEKGGGGGVRFWI